MPMTIALINLSLLLFNIISDETGSSDFDGLGKQLLGGFAIAVVVAVSYTFIKLRLRDKKPPAQFVSINPFQKTDDTSKVGRD
jgi:hypothetical protein